MGFLDKLMNMLQSKVKELEGFKASDSEEPKEEEVISVEEIDSYLSKKDSEINGSFKTKKEVLQTELSAILEKLSLDVEALESYDLDKRRSDERSKKFTTEGRSEYVSAVRKLIENLEQYGIDTELGFIEKELDSFAKATVKSYHKTTILIGKEVEKIVEGITKIRKLESNFMKFNSSLISDRYRLAELLEKNKEKKKTELDLSSVENEKTEMEKSHSDSLKNVADLESKLLEHKGSQIYKRKEALLAAQLLKQNQLKQIQSEVAGLVDRRILGKYAHLDIPDSEKDFVKRFTENPGKTLSSDSELKISQVLKDIRGRLKDKSISLKEPEKSIKKIKIDDKTLITYRTNLENLSTSISGISKELDNIDLSDLEDLELEKNKAQEEADKQKNQISDLEKKQGKLDKTISEINLELTENKRI